MEIIIKSTEILTTIDGVSVRVWKGTTQGGIDCYVFVHRLAVCHDQDRGEFDCELFQQLPPAEHVPLAEVL